MTTITTHVTRADQAANPYFYIPFDVPEATTRIDVVLTYAKAEDCIIDLGAFDPRDTGYPTQQGFRGWSGGARDRFFIATDDATPGYIHGEIQPGTWNVILGLYQVPVAGADVTVTITLDSAHRRLEPQPARTFPVRSEPGWYRGDLHCHTFHSDAKGSPELLHAAANQAGLDFLAVADHNTITQRRYFHPQSSPELIFVRAMEVTTAVGHANVYGMDEWVDFRMTHLSDAHVLERLVHEKGGLLSINHDKPTIPWDYEFPVADCQEVWQSTWLAWNWISLERYQQRLAAGQRISAIGGSDYHQPDRLMPEGPLVLARPTTVLFLPELSEDAVLAAMKAGHGYVTESPTGPHLEMRVGDIVMGGMARALAEVEVVARGAAGDLLVLIDATGLVAKLEIDSDDWSASIPLPPVQKFIRAEIIAGDASRARLIAEFTAALDGCALPWQLKGADLVDQPIRRALGNPIYIGA
ncbi:CehA/McbA family metallohydrolase [Devosia marina]|uniref:PHP domain-containing protein n=1 Tax=Devosia marina TaxID=2683198 RepID=A0A7X3K5J6_9HYPH|nr:CehA/McbA family metallohydrolase [Devosia marina]MVT01004.1 PHP domain-containing protein [Devosia marina]